MTRRQMLDGAVCLATRIPGSVRNGAAVAGGGEATVLVLALPQAELLAQLMAVDMSGPGRVPLLSNRLLLGAGTALGVCLGFTLRSALGCRNRGQVPSLFTLLAGVLGTSERRLQRRWGTDRGRGPRTWLQSRGHVLSAESDLIEGV